MLFGTENADTRISTALQQDVSANELRIYLGGSTYDTALTELSAASSKRAWLSRVQVDTANGNSRTEIIWMRYFQANTDIANVVSVTRHNEMFYTLTENELSTKFFLTVIDVADGKTRFQFIVKNHDCSSDSQLFAFESTILMNNDLWGGG